ncbi:MAG: demethoxyubiquinone hydroxylase family protein [Alphaproteobacteria bacterium]|nr:demethoxyubiquinone hydroxylase family protein [Alphaproteobacteria bacterium]
MDNDPDTSPKIAQRLHGDPDPQTQVERMIRVDHAGEYGAARIYEGQLAVLGNRPVGDAIRAMAEQEQRHLDTFDRMVVDRRVRPTALSPVWHVAGYALGVATAVMGERAAMACTVAVEEVIEEHYARQSEQLGDDEAELRDVIDEFRRDEIEHKTIGLDHIAGDNNVDVGAEPAGAYPALSQAIKSGSRLAIWLSTRV